MSAADRTELVDCPAAFESQSKGSIPDDGASAREMGPPTRPSRFCICEVIALYVRSHNRRSIVGPLKGDQLWVTRLSGNRSPSRLPYSLSWSIIVRSHSGSIQGRESHSWRKLADESREGGIQNASGNAAPVEEQENLAPYRVRIDAGRFMEPAAHSSHARRWNAGR